MRALDISWVLVSTTPVPQLYLANAYKSGCSLIDGARVLLPSSVYASRQLWSYKDHRLLALSVNYPFIALFTSVCLLSLFFSYSLPPPPFFPYSLPPQIRMDAHSVSSHLRVAAIAFALYDLCVTSPAVYRIYNDHRRTRRISVSLLSLILLRFTSIAVLALSSFGFFYDRFDARSCQYYHLLPPTFKVLQAAVCQCILGFRAFNLSRRSPAVGRFLLLLLIATVTLQGLTSLAGRQPQVDAKAGNCLAFSPRSNFQNAYMHYVFAIGYDIVTLSICCYYLWTHKRSSQSSVMTKLFRVTLIDGIGYFIALTCINILNLLLFRTTVTPELQSSAVALSYAFILIMSSRIILHMHEASLEHRETGALAGGIITVTHHLDAAKDVNQALRSQFETGIYKVHDLAGARGNTPVRDSRRFSDTVDPLQQPDHVVEVRVERTVKLSRNRTAFQLETYQSGGGRRDFA